MKYRSLMHINNTSKIGNMKLRFRIANQQIIDPKYGEREKGNTAIVTIFSYLRLKQKPQHRIQNRHKQIMSDQGVGKGSEP